jgi:hypothetical protein
MNENYVPIDHTVLQHTVTPMFENIISFYSREHTSIWPEIFLDKVWRASGMVPSAAYIVLEKIWRPLVTRCNVNNCLNSSLKYFG